MAIQQFRVPQNIDVEAKILGPLTVRQFVTMLAGGLLMFVFYKVADFTLFVFLAVLDVIIVGLLTFYRVNGNPFHFFLLSLIQTIKKPSLRVWQKEVNVAEIKADLAAMKQGVVKEEIVVKPKIGHRSLAQLALLADTGGMYRMEE